MKKGVRISITVISLLFAIILIGGCGEDNHTLESIKKQKTNIILGTYGTSELLEHYVNSYNKSNDDYIIRIKDYSENGSTSFNEAWLEMVKDLSGTQSIDMINIPEGKILRLINSGLIEELTQYYEKERLKENMVECLYDSQTIRNQIYTVCPCFKVSALVIKTRFLQNKEEVSTKSFIELVDKHKEEMLMVDNYSKKDMLELLLENNLSEFIDLKNGESSFMSNSFSDIASLCSTLPEEIKEYEWSDNDEKEVEQFRGDKVLFIVEDFCSPEDIIVAKEKAGEDITILGYPLNGKFNPIVKRGDINIAITAGCRNKDVAWDFAMSFFSHENQEIISQKSNNYIPATKEAFNNKVEKAQVVEYYKNEGGDIIEIPHRWIKGPGWEIKVNAAKKNEVEEFENLVNEAKSYDTYYDEEVMKIILEEMDAYFKDKKTIYEIEEIIQSRVSMYIQENIALE